MSARGAVYIVVAGLIMWAAFSPDNSDVGVDPKDAFFALEHTALGRVGLLLMAVGLFIYSSWRFLTGVFNENNPTQDGLRILTRIGMLLSGAGYAFLGIVAMTVTFGANDPAGPDKTEQIARWLLAMPFGKLLLIGAGAIVAAVGAT
ncbi:MAG: DUF1206 domain-containing protein, partial [Marinicaulis sp.]|nr:DUF1206 domain-containing protein [Marinicaulis sp.]